MSNENAKKARFKSYLKRFRGLHLALLILLFSLTAIGLLLGTERGRVWLVEQAVAQLNQSGEIHIELTELQIPRLANWSLARLEIQSAQQPWVSAREIRLNWLPGLLFKKELGVQNLVFSELSIHPIDKAKTPRQQTESEQLSPAILFSFDWGVQEFAIGRLSISRGARVESVEAMPDWQLRGHARWQSHQTLNAQLKIQSLDEPSSKLDIRLSGDPESELSLTGLFTESAGGFLGRKLHLPAGQPIDAEFNANLSKQDSAYKLALNDLRMPLAAHQIMINGQIVASDQLNEFEVQELNIHIDGQLNQFQGFVSAEHFDTQLRLQNMPLDMLLPWWNGPDSYVGTYVDAYVTAIQSAVLTTDLRLYGSMQSPEARGSIHLMTEYQGLAIDFQTKAGVDKQGAEFDRLNLVAGATNLEAKGQLFWSGAETDLSVRVEQLDIDQWKALNILDVALPENLEALVVSIDAQLSGNIKDPDASLSTELEGRFQEQPFTLSAELEKKSHQIDIKDAVLNLADGMTRITGQLDVHQKSADLAVSAKDLSLELAGAFGLPVPAGLSAMLDGQFGLSGNLEKPYLDGQARLSGQYQGIPFQLLTEGSYSDQQLLIEDIRLSTFDKPTASLTGRMDRHHADLQFQADRLPTQLMMALGWDVKPGLFNADFALKGAYQDLSVQGEMNYQSTFTPYSKNPGSKNTGPEVVDFLLKVSLLTTEDDYLISSKLEYRGDEPGNIKLRVPRSVYQNYLSQYPQIKLDRLPLQAKLSADMALESLSFLLDQDVHQLSGQLRADLDLHGEISNPGVLGELAINRGFYENRQTGTLIDSLDCSMTASNRALGFNDCHASDGDAGHYRLSGEIDLPSGQSPGRIRSRLELGSVNLLSRPDIDSRISGNLDLSGDFDRLTVSGELDVTPLNINLKRVATHHVPVIKVRRMEAVADDENSLKPQAMFSPDIMVDMVINASRQAFLRGQSGLDTELSGQLVLSGPIDNLEYKGHFETLRGQFELFGKKFVFRQGQVYLLNHAVGFNLLGVYSNKSHTIEARLSGTTEDFKLSLSSNPAMPEDEILAYILFGKSINNITPVEAISLLAAVQELRGGGGTFFDPVSRARKSLGLDRLSVEGQSANGQNAGVNVGIGKYLSDHVYLELQRNSDPLQPWEANVIIELTPGIYIETSTGTGTAGTGTELIWKKHY